MTLDEVRAELASSDLSEEAKRILSATLNIGHAFVAEKHGGPFICGHGGTTDSMGLPDHIYVCPFYGVDGAATYKKVSDYSAPGY